MLRRPFWNRMSPWREMDRLRREMDRLFSSWPAGFGQGVASSYPAMSVWTNEDSAVVTAELPGVDSGDINISVANDTLTLSSCRHPRELQEGETYHRQEQSCGKFSRTLQLPFRVESEKVEATLEKGVLRILLPRTEADKPKKILVKAA